MISYVPPEQAVRAEALTSTAATITHTTDLRTAVVIVLNSSNDWVAPGGLARGSGVTGNLLPAARFCLLPILRGEPRARLIQDLVRQLRVIRHPRQNQGTHHRGPSADCSAPPAPFIRT